MNAKQNSRTHTTTIAKANIFALAIMLPVATVFIVPYLLLWPVEPIVDGIDQMLLWFIPVLIIGTIMHELIHGLTWAIFANRGFRSIKFGIKWSMITPYCHCKEPLKKQHYLLGALTPMIFLGIIPGIIAIVLGNPFWLLFGIFFTWAAGGDILGAIMLQKVKKHEWVADHPEMLGFEVVDEPNHQ